MEARDLHRRSIEVIGIKPLVARFKICRQAIYAWGENHPEIRNIPPVEKVRIIVEELKRAGGEEVIGDILSYLASGTGFHVIRFIIHRRKRREVQE